MWEPPTPLIQENFSGRDTYYYYYDYYYYYYYYSLSLSIATESAWRPAGLARLWQHHIYYVAR